MTDEERAAKVDELLTHIRHRLRSCMCPVRAMPCASCKDAASLLDTALADARREGRDEGALEQMKESDAIMEVVKAERCLHEPSYDHGHPTVAEILSCVLQRIRRDARREGAEAMRETLRDVAALSAGWDKDGATGPRHPLSWESVARMALDYARRALEVP